MFGFSSLSQVYRFVFRNAKLTWINILSLSVGLAVVMILLVYLQFQFSFDRHFKDKDRIYRILTVWEDEKTKVYPLCQELLSVQLVKQIPEVERTTRLFRNGIRYIRFGEGERLGVKAYQVDSNFLRVFEFKLVAGELEHALSSPGHCVLTRTTAGHLFGKDTNPVGQAVNLDETAMEYKVAAVIEDLPQNTHFDFDILIDLPDYRFGGLEYFTYLKFREGTDIPEAVDKCNALHRKLLEESFEDFSSVRFGSFTEPLTSLHTSTRSDFDLTPTANKTNLVFIILAAFFVLGIAMSNFVALYLIQGEDKALEISMRKAVGADRGGIIRLLMTETFWVVFLAFLLAVVLYYAFSDAFARAIHLSLPPDIGVSAGMWFAFCGLFVLTLFSVGFYPAVNFSRFSPVQLIRKQETRRYKLTAASVAVQFSVVIFCLVSLLFIGRQLNYIHHLPLGFTTENVFCVPLSVGMAEFEGLRSELLQSPYIEKVAASQGTPLSSGSGQGIRRVDQTKSEGISINEIRVGPGYLDLFDIPVVEGRDFSGPVETERYNVILTENAVAALKMDEPVGKKVMIWESEPPFTVIGVAGDVLQSAHAKTDNFMYTSYAQNFYVLVVKFVPGQYVGAKSALLEVIARRYKGVPVNVISMAEAVRQVYFEDEIAFRIVSIATCMAIFLALLGLVALCGFAVRQKSREISLRRVVGADIFSIVADLNYYLFLRILPAVPVGLGLGYYAMHRWLGSFEYAVSLDAWIFILALLLTLLLVSLVTLYQCLKAATANPVDALRNE